MKYRELNLGQIEAVVNKLGGMDGVQRLLRDEVKIVAKAAESVFSIVVDYSLSLAEMVKAGKYDWVNDDITAKHFPAKGEGKKELAIELIHFNRRTSSEEALQEMDKQGFRPATIEELLALGSAYPELQRKFPIAALGSVWQDPNGYRHVPCLGESVSRRSLHLHWLGGGWGGDWRFAAVRK